MSRLVLENYHIRVDLLYTDTLPTKLFSSAGKTSTPRFWTSSPHSYPQPPACPCTPSHADLLTTDCPQILTVSSSYGNFASHFSTPIPHRAAHFAPNTATFMVITSLAAASRKSVNHHCTITSVILCTLSSRSLPPLPASLELPTTSNASLKTGSQNFHSVAPWTLS